MPVSKKRKSKNATQNRKRSMYTGTNLIEYVKEGVGYLDADQQAAIFGYVENACNEFKTATASLEAWKAINVGLIISMEIDRRGVVLRGLRQEIQSTMDIMQMVYCRFTGKPEDHAVQHAWLPCALSPDEVAQITFFATYFRMQVSSLTVREYSDVMYVVERKIHKQSLNK